MSDRSKKGIGVASGQWLKVEDFARAVMPKAADAPKPAATEPDPVNDMSRAVRGRLDTLDEINDGRPTLDEIPIDIDESALDRFRATDRPDGGDEALVALDDKLTGESIRMIHCFTIMQSLAMKVGSRELLVTKALKDGRYFPFAFPYTEGPNNDLVMRTHVVDIDDLKTDSEASEALISDLYTLTAFKDNKSIVLSREERINLIKALTAFYADYAGEKLEDLGIDYIRALETLNKFKFKPAFDRIFANIPALDVPVFLSAFTLKLKKTFLESRISRKTSVPLSTTSETQSKVTSDPEDVLHRNHAKKLVDELVTIGNDLKKVLETDKIPMPKAVELINDMLYEKPLEVGDYMDTYHFIDQFEGRAFIRRVLEARRAIAQMDIEDSFVFSVLGENLINNAVIQKTDLDKLTASLKKKARK